jgi:hypothetical protein
MRKYWRPLTFGSFEAPAGDADGIGAAADDGAPVDRCICCQDLQGYIYMQGELYSVDDAGCLVHAAYVDVKGA